MTTIENVLHSKGPMMSSDLAKQVAKLEGIQLNTASQKVGRDKSIQRVKGFFTSGQSYCFLDDHIGKTEFFEGLLNLFKSHGKKYWYCLNAISMNGGVISEKYLKCYTKYPIGKLKSHRPFKEVMQDFVSSGLLIFSGSSYLIAPRFQQSFVSYSQSQTIEAIKDTILEDFNSLARNIGLISYNSGEKFAEFGKFQWCFKGLCPVMGLRQDNNFGFLLADVLFGHQIHEDDVAFYIDKLETIRSFKNASRIFPILIVDNVHPDALEALKKNGIVVGLISELFGKKYAEALNELVQVLKNAGASLKNEPDKYLQLLEQLKRYNEGLTNNLKGAFFELVVGQYHPLAGNTSIDLGREIFVSDGRHEIDVLAVYPDRVVFAECKATKAQVELEKIDTWISDKIPAFQEWAQKQETWVSKKLEFEYWSTSGFEKDAQEKLERFSMSAKKFNVRSVTGSELREHAIKTKNKKLKEALDNFFLKSVG